MLSKVGDASDQLNWYKCPVCNQTIKDSQSLVSHLKDVHHWEGQKANEEGVNQITKIDKRDL